jgi:hypothetical protein
MSAAHTLLNIIEEHKQNLPDALYLQIACTLNNLYNFDDKEKLIVAIIADSFAQTYFEDDDACIAKKVTQRILKIKCTPILDSELDYFCCKSPAHIIEAGKYMESWFTTFRKGELQKIPNEEYPIVIGDGGDNNHTNSLVILSAKSTPTKTSKRTRVA